LTRAVTLRLVPFAPAHFPVLGRWFATEAEAVLWGGPDMRAPVDEAQLAPMLAESLTSPPGRLCWMAAEGAGDRIVGHAQLAFEWRHGVARLGRVAVAPGSRGQGLARPMLALVIDRAFAWPEIERVELNVYTNNAPAIRTYRALGFVPEGVRRSSVRVGTERWDTQHMGLLRPEWQAHAPVNQT
jgi:RimJ/RimL family protein N-acetyltransferase